MSAWEIVSEEASIVLVGNFNPRIFHPEWFIRKGIVEEWDYSKDEMVNLPDLARFTLPGNKKISVLLNQFALKSPMASEHLALKDCVISAFSALRETPILQLGMNFTSTIKIADKSLWLKFGEDLAPKQPWLDTIDYLDELKSENPEKLEELGLWDMSFNLPRPDGLKGYIRPKISSVSTKEGLLSIAVNNHVEIEADKGTSAMQALEVLDQHWEESLKIAQDLTDRQLNSALGG